jgi:tRNA-binding protein
MAEEIQHADFEKVEIRVGTIVAAEDFPEARNPAFKLVIDFGGLGTKKSSAQITKLYKKEELVGKQVVAVVNFPPKQVANFRSECLVLGVVLDEKEVVLLHPERRVPNGKRIL